MSYITGVLSLSPNTGRYSLGEGGTGLDITSGASCEIFFGSRGEWVRGSVEHAGGIYAEEGKPQGHGGYYFIGPGGICGLCVGMKVRIRREIGGRI